MRRLLLTLTLNIHQSNLKDLFHPVIGEDMLDMTAVLCGSWAIKARDQIEVVRHLQSFLSQSFLQSVRKMHHLVELMKNHGILIYKKMVSINHLFSRQFQINQSQRMRSLVLIRILNQ